MVIGTSQVVQILVWFDPHILFSSLAPCFMQDDVDAKFIVAGLSTTCSQKIHNQLVGKLVTTL